MTRHFWVLVHRYAGLYMAFFLIVAGLTGSILAFDNEIDRWLNPPEIIVPQGGPRLDEFALRERAEALVPEGRDNSLDFHRKPDEAYTAFLEPRSNPDTDEPYELTANRITLNPYTGAELSREKMGDDIWPITRKNFLMLIVRLHYQLALPGSIGTWLFGIAALLWTVDCFIGAYLTFPLAVRRKSARDATPHPSWWSRWKPSWLVKWRASALRVNFDLHRAGGLWVWLMLLVLAWSSVGFNLGEQIYTPVMKALFAMPDPYGEAPELEKPKPEPDISWQEAQRIGRQLMAEQAQLHDFNVLYEQALQYNAEKGLFFYIVHSDRDIMDEGGSTWLMLDGTTGKFAGLSLPIGANAGTTINSWIFTLHMALIWGLPFKVFLGLVGLVIVMLSVTGVYLWLKKRQAVRYAEERRSRLAKGLNV